VRTRIGAIVVIMLAALSVACTRPPLRPPPGIQDKIDRDARLEGANPAVDEATVSGQAG
jgi:hypothetical protein